MANTCFISIKMKAWSVPEVAIKTRSSVFFASITAYQLIVTFFVLNLTCAISPVLCKQNVQKIQKGDPSTVIAVEIPDNSTGDLSFPRLKFVNDSSELHEEDERIAKDGKMISGVATRFGKRSIRAYYPSSSSHGGGMMMTGGGGGNPYNSPNYNRFTRFDNRRNSFDSVDGHSSSSSSLWDGKWFNTLKRRTSMMMSPMMMSSYDRQQLYQNQGTADEPDMSATMSGGGGGYGHSSYGKASVNKSAVGLLGFLSLLSLIQNVLNQTAPMAGGRRRREITENMQYADEDEEGQFDYYDWDDAVKETTMITPHLLPMLNAVTHAQNGQVMVECTLQPICSANRVLVEKLGDERGKLVGQILSEALSKTLKQAGWRWKTSDWDIRGRVIRAGMSGRNGRNCWRTYKCCPKLDKLTQHSSINAIQPPPLR